MFKTEIQNRSNEVRPIKYGYYYTLEKSLMKSGCSKIFLIWGIYIKHDSLEDNRKCTKGSFGKSHMKPGPSDMVLVRRIY